jgi:hypothetical protein
MLAEIHQFRDQNRSVLTEIYLCHACSDHEIGDGKRPGRAMVRGARAAGAERAAKQAVELAAMARAAVGTPGQAAAAAAAAAADTAAAAAAAAAVADAARHADIDWARAGSAAPVMPPPPPAPPLLWAERPWRVDMQRQRRLTVGYLSCAACLLSAAIPPPLRPDPACVTTGAGGDHGIAHNKY